MRAGLHSLQGNHHSSVIAGPTTGFHRLKKEKRRRDSGALSLCSEAKTSLTHITEDGLLASYSSTHIEEKLKGEKSAMG